MATSAHIRADISTDIATGLPAPALPMHLLVVDDDDVDRERVLRLLGRSALNFDAKEAASSDDALQLLREHEFDCVMLDHRLGDVSGAALLPAIRQVARRDCPVIMITGAGNESLAVQALQLGAADYLTKFNLDADMLVRAIQRALEHHRLRRELDDLHQRLEQRVAQQAAAIRQNERDLRATLDATPTVIGSWDRKLCNRFGNRAWRGWAGIDPALLPGRHLADVVGAAAVERIAGHVDAVLRGERRHFELAVPADALHAERHAQWTLLPDLADDGTVRGFYSSITDVSGIRQAQAALVAARDAAEQATRAKSQFLANMSHEIRTPMNAIVGLTQLALAEGLPVRTQAFIDTAHQSARALMGLLDDVLDYSKVEAGELRLELQPLDLVQVVRRSADLFSARIAEKGLGFALELAPGLPRRVRGDALRLSQVLNNLLGNAVKFTERGRVRLVVRPADGLPGATGADNGRLQFVVHDSGVGVAPEHQAGLFEAFTQADNSITRRFGGTGLGLAICRRLVTMMGGEIGFDSQPGAGSAFWFTVDLPPADAGVDDEAAAPLPAMPPPPAQAHPLRGLRLLLVEDNDTNRLVARIWLERLGAVVQQAGDGAQALALLQDSATVPPDAVLMDMHMPVMDGLEATRRLQALPALRGLPVIGMTAAALAEDRRQCLDAGMVDHVTKPIVVEQLVATLLHWTGRQPPADLSAEPSAEAPADPSADPSADPPAEAPPATVLPGFDLAGLRAMLHGNETLLLRMLAMFVAQEAGTGAALAALLDAGEIDAACNRLHQLRGGAGAVGALQVSAAAAELERALRAGRPAGAEHAAFSQALGAALAAARGLVEGPSG
jgi:signal transduction histidine kinase/HPt (histidine-containing phosphotransfer) domain-containing protein